MAYTVFGSNQCTQFWSLHFEYFIGAMALGWLRNLTNSVAWVGVSAAFGVQLRTRQRRVQRYFKGLLRGKVEQEGHLVIAEIRSRHPQDAVLAIQQLAPRCG